MGKGGLTAAGGHAERSELIALRVARFAAKLALLTLGVTATAGIFAYLGGLATARRLADTLSVDALRGTRRFRRHYILIADYYFVDAKVILWILKLFLWFFNKRIINIY